MDDSLPAFDSPRQLAAAAADPYYEALATWLEGKPANTRRSYFYAVRSFLNFTRKHPEQIRPVDVAAWKEALKGEGNADSTVTQRLSDVLYFGSMTKMLTEIRGESK